MAKIKNNTDLVIRVTDLSGFCIAVAQGETREVPDSKVALCQGKGLSLVGKAPAAPKPAAKDKAPAAAETADETLAVNPD